MKTIVSLLLALAIPAAIFAQEEKTANEYKNEGNALVKEKNYQDALTAYEKALELWGDSVDAPTVYNAATCAKGSKQYDKAIKYYKQSIELDYKADYATYFLSDVYDKNGEPEAQLETLLVGFEKYKTGKPASFIQKSLVKIYRDDAMVYYNEGQKILGEWTAEKDAEIKSKAKEQFKQAKPLIEKALEVNPEDENCKQILANINEQLK